MTRLELIDAIESAIAEFEGFNVTEGEAKSRSISWPTIAQRNCNPGNLRSWPGYPVVEKYAQFPGPAIADWSRDFTAAQKGCIIGRAALRQQINANVFGLGRRDRYPLRSRGMNLYEFFGGQRDDQGGLLKGGYPGYAPAKDNNHPRHYAEFVASRVGIKPDVKLAALIDNNTTALASKSQIDQGGGSKDGV